MLLAHLSLLFQTSVAALPAASAVPHFATAIADSVFTVSRSFALESPRWDQTRLYDGLQDTLRRRRRVPTIEYSETYHTRVGIHKALSYVMIPLFIGSAYTGFQLRNKKEAAPQWARDIHGPLAAGTAVVFGMNTLTGVWNMWEGRKDPQGRGKRLLHGGLFLAAVAGFTYVTVAGDNIYSSGKPNRWHRDVALASMGVSVVSWSLMIFR